jgi:hypothetical protein
MALIISMVEAVTRLRLHHCLSRPSCQNKSINYALSGKTSYHTPTQSNKSKNKIDMRHKLKLSTGILGKCSEKIEKKILGVPTVLITVS